MASVPARPALAAPAPEPEPPLAAPSPAGAAASLATLPKPPRRPRPVDKPATRRERPRERLLMRGPAALSEPELLGLLLGNGIAGRTMDTVVHPLFAHFKTLRALLDADPKEIQHFPGVGEGRAAVLIATTELVRRALTERAVTRAYIDSPAAVEDLLRLTIGTRSREVFVCVYMDAQHRLIRCEESTLGTLTRMAVYPREIVGRALQLEAPAVVVAHNHPSGAVRPSAEDQRLTHVLREALALVDVRLIDHIVVGASDTFSFAQAGLL